MAGTMGDSFLLSWTLCTVHCLEVLIN